MIGSPIVFVCPTHPEQRCSYAFNQILDGKPDSIPPDTVMFFEADAGWNASGGVELIGTGNSGHPSKSGSVIVGFVDGSVRQIPRSQITALRWKP